MKNSVSLAFGKVSKKKIDTENHFVSHMIEHLAWRMGLEIQLSWKGEDWDLLGSSLGQEIRRFKPIKAEAKSLGMIDDGAAIVQITLGDKGVSLNTVGFEKSFFLNLRCEQLNSGDALVELLQGLSDGLGASIVIDVFTLEDPHHTWEAVFRGVGTTLSKLFTPTIEGARKIAEPMLPKVNSQMGLEIVNLNFSGISLKRTTAESSIELTLQLESEAPSHTVLEVDSSIVPAVTNIQQQLSLLTDSLAASLQIRFRALNLSSSHVVLEDIGLILGRGVRELMKLRMDVLGINAAGASISGDTGQQRGVSVGLSFEGRKFLRLVPCCCAYSLFLRECILGRTLINGLRGEDLDDFLDGFAGGLGGSLMFLIHEQVGVEQFWTEAFSGLGTALKEAFIPNTYRLGVPPGVKGNLV